MKQIGIRFLAIIHVVFIIIMSITSCNGRFSNNVDTSQGDDMDTVSPLILVDGENTVCRIVKGINSGIDVSKIADNIAMMISTYTGVTPIITTDTAVMGSNTSDEGVDILVGSTKCSESIEALNEISYGGYIVKRIGTKVVINAYCLNGLKAAEGEFSKIVLSEAQKGYLAVATDMYKTGTISSLLDNLPIYKEGMVDITFNSVRNQNMSMVLLQNTNINEYSAYCETLRDSGYTLYNENQVNGSLFHSYVKGTDNLVYTYYNATTNQTRIIISEYGDGLLPIDYQKTEKVAEPSITQVSLDYSAGDDLGMCYIITLADGRFIIVDGGNALGNSTNILHETLQKLNKRSGTPTIAAWILTHAHSDHFANFYHFAMNYGSQYILEYSAHNVPHEDAFTLKDPLNYNSFVSSGKFQAAIDAFVGTAKSVILHTGMKFNLGGAVFETLYTWEDIYPNTFTTFNNTSLILRMELEGQSFVITADAYGVPSDMVVSTFGAEYIKSDFLQVGHHGFANGGSSALYEAVHPSVVFWPSAQYIFEKYSVEKCPSGEIYKADYVELHVLAFEKTVTIKLPYTSIK